MSSGLNLGTARTLLPSACFEAGKAASAALAAPYVNAATAWILSMGKWVGTRQRAAFTVNDNQVTLPREMLAMMGASIQGTGDRSRCKTPYPIANLWYQWLPGGPGLVVDSPHDVFAFTDQGDGFVTFRDLPSAGRVRVKTTVANESGIFSVRGYSGGNRVFTGTLGRAGSLLATGTLSPNVSGVWTTSTSSNGQPLYVFVDSNPSIYLLGWNSSHWTIDSVDDSSTYWTGPATAANPVGTYSPTTPATGTLTISVGYSYGEGEDLILPNSVSDVTSATTFDAGNSLYAIVKPTTIGVLTFYHVAEDGTETLIGRYEPGETIPNYRRYFVPQRTGDDGNVIALCKRKFVPVAVDNDQIIPGNLTALELAMMAVNYRRNAEMARARDYIAMAIDELNSSMEEFESVQSLGSVQVDQFVGMGSGFNIL